ncbi:MAG: DUF6920 family protein [Bryobacteraceae bacterium]
MRQILAALCGIHGLCHLAGLTTGQMYPVWIALAAAFLFAAHGLNSRAAWWLPWTVSAAVASTIACVAAGPSARLGIVVNALIVIAACYVFRDPGQVRNAELESLWERAPRAVRMQMHGEIKIGRWFPFHAEQVLASNDGMIWAAQVRMFGLPVIGADRFVNGEGSMSWNLLGLVPIASAAGPDVTRSARERWQAERTSWLPESGSPIPKSFSFKRWGNPDNTGYRELDFGVVVEETREIAGNTIPTRLRAGWFYNGSGFANDGEFFRATVDTAEYR